MKVLRSVLALVLLIAVVVSATWTVSMAGQRDRLREKVQALTVRAAALETRITLLEQSVALNAGRLQFWAEPCDEGQPAVWRLPGDGRYPLHVLSC